MLGIQLNLAKLSERENLLEEALSLSDIKSDVDENKPDSGKVKIMMEKNRWTIEFGTEVIIIFFRIV